MQVNLFSKILDVFIVLSLIGFFAALAYYQVPGVAPSIRVFSLAWASIYVFSVTLGFRGSIEAHRDDMRRFAAEWLGACFVGGILAIVVIMFF